MKTTILILAILFCCMGAIGCVENTVKPSDNLQGDTVTLHDDFYYYYDEKIPLEKVPNKYFIITDTNVDLTTLFEGTKILQEGKDVMIGMVGGEPSQYFTPHKGFRYSDSTKYAVIETSTPIDVLLDNENVQYVTHNYSTSPHDIKSEISISNILYLTNPSNIELLEEIAHKNGMKIAGTDELLLGCMLLVCDKHSKGNALEMANMLQETKCFGFVFPDIWGYDGSFCVNDTYFDNQWGLENTMYNYNTDINVCAAWEYTKGVPSVKVAVVDMGIQLNHPDLQNIYSLSYDVETNASPSTLYGAHGTHVAGIIGATADNNIGISGVASECNLMSISANLADMTQNGRARRANGINWAVNQGADIINNSWGWQSTQQYLAIDLAITNALTNGRNGKGCVVVFATGNDNSSVAYPANSNPDILAIGATRESGFRRDNSNYGDELDIVAPGHEIRSTLSNSSYGDLSGTSMAAPFVSGVAALILSVNPNLTGQQVRDIIEQDRTKNRKLHIFYNVRTSKWHLE